MTVISIPRINDEMKDFITLFQIWNEINELFLNGCSRVYLDFSNCDFLRQNAVAFLGGLIRYSKEELRKSVEILLDTLNPNVERYLRGNRFLSHVCSPRLKSPDSKNSIPYREDENMNREEITSYLSEEWLGKGWVQLSEDLANEIVNTVLEIYNNVFDHSCSKIGVVSCGQHYPNLRKLKLAVVDFGVGIPYNVNEYRKNKGKKGISSDMALRWAFRSGTSTKSEIAADSEPRGLGLLLLKKFIKLNKGSLQVFSQDGYALIDGNGPPQYSILPVSFKGTMVNISLNCDDHYYFLS